MDLNINKFSKICRTCLIEKVNMRPIFDAYVADMLMECANVQVVENDGLPKTICLQCLQQVNRRFCKSSSGKKGDCW
ncbi:hypothetical protein ILUMI_00912 [Ignelater luminosus]|uniref:ZAD domain-containing protein n=1 Tax=Ignelater luminosus TaxID=2038154 RepID=A0A8K0DJA7_IGNLU|nr:hypothetical protein ILUMI_00912 [Ignelater luminosus]